MVNCEFLEKVCCKLNVELVVLFCVAIVVVLIHIAPEQTIMATSPTLLQTLL